MDITVFGASGGTGRCVVQQALDQGHSVTAVVRDALRLPLGGRAALTVVEADVMSPTEIGSAVSGSDAVISALGPSGRGPTTVPADAARSIIAAMRQAGARRLLVVSNSGMFSDGDTWPMRTFAKPILRRVLRHSYAAARQMEREVQDSGLDWSIVRPPRLTNGPLTTRYRTCRDRNVRAGLRISRADLAHCLLRLAADPEAHRAAVSVAY